MHWILSGVHREKVQIKTDICKHLPVHGFWFVDTTYAYCNTTVVNTHSTTKQWQIHIMQTNSYTFHFEFEYIYICATKQPKMQFKVKPAQGF